MAKISHRIASLSLVGLLLVLPGCAGNAPTDSSPPVSTAANIADTTTTTSVTTTTAVPTTTTAENASDTTTPSTATTTTTPAPTQGLAFSVSQQVRIQQAGQTTGNQSGVISGWQVLCSSKDVNTTNLDKLGAYMNGKPLDSTIYTADYFADKAVLLLYFSLPSGSIRIAVDALTADGDTLTVHYTRTHPAVLTADMAQWCVLVEVAKDAVNNIQKIRGEETIVTTPSGVPAQ